MLSRVANSLYWMGRYIERTEHLTRYLNVQYFSTLDAPMSQNKPFVLHSILNLFGLSNEDEEEQELAEEEVLFKAALDPDNTSSILSAITSGRENARGIRSIISGELWEAINKYYHFANKYPVDIYKTRGLYDFCMNAIQHCAAIRANVDNTLIHDNVYAMIYLGIHLERAAQITRILSSKLHDIYMITSDQKKHPVANYQWTITLKVLEAFDMSYRYFKAAPNQRSICEFLIINKDFPRSIAFNVGKLNTLIQQISIKKNLLPESIEFQVGKLANYYKFLSYEEIEDDLQTFLTDTLTNIYKIHQLIEKEYMPPEE
ncbi:MAG TPA: hypothetical protein DCS93_21310 [Microscillaceae bacterium]|nr:hypothetical protein [Microscillaceae bacterium]